jgi:hypothetical protein
MGPLPIEEAFWILIPTDHSQKVSWLPAMGQQGGLPASIRLPTTVLYESTDEQVWQLRDAAFQCDWVAHTHNHPREPYPGLVGSILPSNDDLVFARVWRERLPEAADRMRFFVIHGGDYAEYARYPE